MKIRQPDNYTTAIPDKHRQKWEDIIQTYMTNKIDDLLAIQRTGSRGRIFHYLVTKILDTLSIRYESEPVFNHIEPDPWYIDFTNQRDLKLRTHSFYNPDFFIPEDGTWIEVTLSENTAYQKIFRYGHQHCNLKIIWLDEDQGLHKDVCADVSFPNVEVVNVSNYFPMVDNVSKGVDLIAKINQLTDLKNIVL